VLAVGAVAGGALAAPAGLWGWSALTSANAAPTAEPAAPPLDLVVFGDAASESAHGLIAPLSTRVAGDLGQSARRLLPATPAGSWGGTLAVRAKVDPNLPTYVTVKLSGSEFGLALGRLMLFCEGKQVGYYHLGDIDPLDIAGNAPVSKGRFFYRTLPLPLSVTAGKANVTVEIRAMGEIYGYGSTLEGYYRNLAAPSRAVYRLYTHTDTFLALPADDVQAPAVINPPTRPTPGDEVLTKVRTRIVTNLNAWMNATTQPSDQKRMLALAKAYAMPWTPAYRNPKALDAIVAGMDAVCRYHATNPTKMEPNDEQWLGFGRAGWALALVYRDLGDRLSATVDVDGSAATPAVPRRRAYADLMHTSREHWRRNRRAYTNQAMICDLGIYLANRALAVLDPGRALPETQALRYLYESVGLDPWLGPDDATGKPTRPYGDVFFQLTRARLTKELGYVGVYGEVLDWIGHIYQATALASPGGDARIRQLFTEAAQARAYFRYPVVDAGGHRSMSIEAMIGWRDADYPGKSTYAQRTGWDGSSIYAAGILDDPRITGYAQQMFADNQFFADIDSNLSNSSSRVTLMLLDVPDHYATLKARPATGIRLPMSDGAPDSVFYDTENGALAIKHGDDRLYFSVYWRARYGVNNLARFHHITPALERSGTIRQETVIDDSGLVYTRGDAVNMAFGNGGLNPPGTRPAQALAGEKLPVAKVPTGFAQPRVGTENPFVGRALFYRCRYGRYLIGVNDSGDRSFNLTVPAGFTAVDLVNRQQHAAGATVPVARRTAAVLFLTSTSGSAGPTTPPPATGSYKIINRNSGKVLTIAADGLTVVQRTDTGAANQRFQLVDLGSGYAKVVNPATGKVLDVFAESLLDLGKVCVWADTGGANQQWAVTTLTGGFRKLVNRNSGKALDVAERSLLDDAAVVQWTDHGGTNQQWTFTAG